MEFSIKSGSPEKQRTGCLVVGVHEGRKLSPTARDVDAASRNFLIFRLGDRARVVLRPSGTEPKAKAYIEVCSAPCPPGTPAAEWERSRRETDELARQLADDFLRQALGTVGLKPPAQR